MTDHSFKDRVRREAQELHIKIERLQAFIDAGTVYDSLPPDEQARLSDQLYHMHAYGAILSLRIQNFDGE